MNTERKLYQIAKTVFDNAESFARLAVDEAGTEVGRIDV